MLPTDAILPLVLFTLLMLMLSLHGLAASGHFPREHRTAAPRSPLGTAILYGTILIALLSLIAGLVAAWRLIPWYAAVIAGGLAILSAPLVLQQFSDNFVDDRGSLLSFGGASAALAIILSLLATNQVALSEGPRPFDAINFAHRSLCRAAPYHIVLVCASMQIWAMTGVGHERPAGSKQTLSALPRQRTSMRRPGAPASWHFGLMHRGGRVVTRSPRRRRRAGKAGW